MVKKHVFYFVWSLLVAVVSSLVSSATSFASLDFYGMALPVSGSPFDTKARSAGCFNIPLPSGLSLPDQGSIEALFRIARSFRYVTDRGRDRWQSADETESKHAGDCEDKAIWLFTRLIERGYSDVRLVIGRYRSIDSKLHVWVVCTDRNGNVDILDPAMQKRAWDLNTVDSGFYRPLYAYDGQNCYRYPTNSD